jgi:hypothetical protein
VIVAIHQPNYFPWLGYFYKIARADIFVLLDDVQFSKSSYTNRVQILFNGRPRWLTVPIRVSLGQLINTVLPASEAWRMSHLSLLHHAYGDALHFQETWRIVERWIEDAPSGNLGKLNGWIIGQIAAQLGTHTRIIESSDLGVRAEEPDMRLAAIADAVSPSNPVYLSGRGGAKYQRPETFEKMGVALRYVEFDHPLYAQRTEQFFPGLSVLDAAFHLGWQETRRLVSA